MRSERPTLAPLVLEFEVTASIGHAFSTWVERPRSWWPPTHTRSGDPSSIVFEPGVGGRIYEVDADGNELPWGQIVAWDPPHRLEFSWHHVFPADERTHVSLTFRPGADPDSARTIVRIEQTGWDALGVQGASRRAGNTRGWNAVLGALKRHLEGAPT